jgi:hypothetical protein
MSNSNRRPTFRIRFRDKATKTTYDVATCWPSERFEGLHDVSPQKTDEAGQYPRMRMDEAVRRTVNGEGWLSLSSTEAKPKAAPPRASDFNEPEPF